MQKGPELLAWLEYRDWVIYRELAAMERSPRAKQILERFVEQEHRDFLFWKARSEYKHFHIRNVTVWWHKAMRRILGLAFTAKLLERREREAHERYSAYLLSVADVEERAFIEQAIEQEKMHERELIGLIEEKSLNQVSNIVLGVNDGLIELSGALTGFALAFQATDMVALSGLITGIAAALSMTASAYLQAAHEKGKNAWSAGIYTGLSYLAVVAVMVSPFFIADTIIRALTSMLVLMAGIVAALSIYTAVLFGRSFKKQFFTMLILSVGVAVIAFGIGLLARIMLGVTV